jgi:hypothetical protein
VREHEKAKERMQNGQLLASEEEGSENLMYSLSETENDNDNFEKEKNNFETENDNDNNDKKESEKKQESKRVRRKRVVHDYAKLHNGYVSD